MDAGILKKTQDTLGKIIKKPPLTEKLLTKPPFRFLHDVMTSVIKTTGFMKGLYTDSEMNSENVKEKEAKIAFLQKAIDMVAAVMGGGVSAKPAKIVAGHEPEKTNEFLQALAAAINANADNDEIVKRVLSGGGGEGGKKDRDKSKDSKDRARSASRKKDDDKRKKEDKEKSHDRDRDRGEKKHRDRSGEGREEKEKHKERREKSREDRHRDKDRERRKKKEVEEKENESPEQNGEKDGQDAPSRLQRPTSAKGSRRRRQGREAHDDDDEEFQHRESSQPAIGENDLPPQITAARKMARPPSARPAPPRPKQDGVEAEPAMRLGTGAPSNVIVDDGKQSDDEDENFLVEESAPPPPVTEPTPSQAEGEDDAEHGALVKKMLESKKEAEQQQQQQQPTKKTEIERPTLSDAQRRKQREQVSKEIERLQASIQALTRSANPLGKIMDYVQEDMDSMQKELDKWRSENKEHALALRRERNVTDRAIEPLKAQLADLDRAIADQLDLIAASKSNIMRTDKRIEKMLHSIARS